MLNYTETNIEELHHDIFDDRGVRVFIKHEELNHPKVSGNKFWKLKYNLDEAKRLGHDTLLTFGGAFSNHIYSTAAAAKEEGFKSIGIIRGEEVLPLNITLAFAKTSGMRLHYISREAYRKKTGEHFIEELRNRFGNFYLVPEGGTNALAVKGCAEFASEKLASFEFDCVCLPVGTGGTTAGIIAGLKGKKKVIGFSVLKNGDFLNNEIEKLIQQHGGTDYANWEIQIGYHFGGYAKQNAALTQFIAQMKDKHNLLLDHVYTGKLVAGVFDLIRKNYFERGSRILILHTGGLR